MAEFHEHDHVEFHGTDDPHIYFIRMVDFGEANGMDTTTGDVQSGCVMSITPRTDDNHPDPEPLHFIMQPVDLGRLMVHGARFLTETYPGLVDPGP